MKKSCSKPFDSADAIFKSKFYFISWLLKLSLCLPFFYFTATYAVSTKLYGSKKGTPFNWTITQNAVSQTPRLQATNSTGTDYSPYKRAIRHQVSKQESNNLNFSNVNIKENTEPVSMCKLLKHNYQFRQDSSNRVSNKNKWNSAHLVEMIALTASTKTTNYIEI